MQKTTTNHAEIKEWVTLNNGKPYLIDQPEAQADREGIRINFPGTMDEALLGEEQLGHEISWETFFKIFEEEKLIFVYEVPIAGADPTMWYRFENRAESI